MEEQAQNQDEISNEVQKLVIDEDINLELLCNQVEAEQLKEERRQEIKQMNKRMDLKIAMIKAEKQKAKESQMIDQTKDLKEKYTGLLMQKRLLKDDDVDIYTSAREFIPIETLDNIITFNSSVLKAFFTIGVIVDVSGPIMSKNGKPYSIMRISDLIKYDIIKVKQILEQESKGNDEQFKMAEKCFNNNGYKTLKVMAFGEPASFVAKLTIGTVVGLLNPKAMKSTPDQGFTFCIDLEAQVFKIGFSEELTFCKGIPKNFSQNGLPFMSTTIQSACRNFLNKSIETICDPHKFMLQEQKLARIRSSRVNLHTDFLDLNKIRRQQEQEEIEKKIGAFNPYSRSFKNNKQPVNRAPPISPKTKERLMKQRKFEQDSYNNFIKEREQNIDKNKNKGFLSGLVCNETQHLNKAWYPGMTAKADKKEVINKNEENQENKETKNDQQIKKDHKIEAKEEDCGLEIEGSDDEFGIQNFSLRNILQNKKMKFNERFDSQSADAVSNDDLKRKKLQ